jgi:hypothetical protein
MSLGHEELNVFGQPAAEVDPDFDHDSDLDEEQPQPPAGGVA